MHCFLFNLTCKKACSYEKILMNELRHIETDLKRRDGKIWLAYFLCIFQLTSLWIKGNMARLDTLRWKLFKFVSIKIILLSQIIFHVNDPYYPYMGKYGSQKAHIQAHL